MATAADKPAPTVAAIAVATLIIGVLGGYFLGSASSIGVFGSSGSSLSLSSRRARGSGKGDLTEPEDGSSDEEDEDDEDEEEGEQQPTADLNGWADSREEFKMTLVVRTDLGMTKGKIAAQCGHAVLANYKTLLRANSPVLAKWERRGQAKVALQAKSEEDLDLLFASAMSLGLCANVIHDAGRTQIASGSATVLAVGPGPKSVVDQCTGGLKLL